MLVAAFLPPGTPPWVRIVLELCSLLLAARVLLYMIRRGRIGALALAAAAWVWFFYPPGHAWTLAATRRAWDEARMVMPALAGQAMHAAGRSAAALGAAAHGSTPAPGAAAAPPNGGGPA